MHSLSSDKLYYHYNVPYPAVVQRSPPIKPKTKNFTFLVYFAILKNMPRVSKRIPPPLSKPHYKGLTPNERDYVDALVSQAEAGEKQNLSKAAREAYPNANDSSAKAMGWEKLNKPVIRDAYLAEMERQGLSDDRSIQVMSEAMKANKIHSSPTEPDKIVPDHNIRLNAAKEYHKVKGVYPDKHVTVDKRTANVHLFEGWTEQKIYRELYKLNREISSLQKDIHHQDKDKQA